MCGIAGFVTKNSSPIDETLLRRMGDAIEHRGPDAEGFFTDANAGVGLANRRLSIIDIEGGAQPMSNDDESIWITYNGEIYNFPELRQKLIDRGVTFHTRSDTEVILKAYELDGVDALATLNGIFGLAIYDRRAKKVILARDEFGVKPVYYAETHNKTLFGSEIRSILADPDIARRVDPPALEEYITFRYNPSPRTLFAGIKKLAPGHFVEITAAGPCEPKRYLPEHRPENVRIDETQAIEEYRRLLRAAVTRQMLSDVPVALFLSGGVDSASIGFLMAESSTGSSPIKSYTVGFPGKGDHNELADARESAKLIGSEHHETIIDSREYLEFFARSFSVLEEPIAETSVSALYYLSRRAAEDVKVVLAGQGADEPMAGYHRYLGVSLVGKYGPFVRAASPLIAALPRSARAKQAAIVARYSSDIERLMAVYSIFTPAERARLSPEITASTSAPERLRELLNEADKLPDLLSKMMYVDTRMSLADDLLLFNDKVTMATSLEMRVPFLDRDLINFLETLPADLKLRGLTRKYIHKRAATAWLPKEVVYRRKRGFQTPMDVWLQTGLADAALRLFDGPDSACARYFDREFMRELIAAHRLRKQNNQKKIYALLSFELWHRDWIDRKPIDPEMLTGSI